ncbi:hypothetical protein Bca4012_084261 [Brassica carinata]
MLLVSFKLIIPSFLVFISGSSAFPQLLYVFSEFSKLMVKDLTHSGHEVFKQ